MTVSRTVILILSVSIFTAGASSAVCNSNIFLHIMGTIKNSHKIGSDQVLICTVIFRFVDIVKIHELIKLLTVCIPNLISQWTGDIFFQIKVK